MTEALTLSALAVLLTALVSPGFASWLAGRLRATAEGLERHAAGMAAAYAAYRAIQRAPEVLADRAASAHNRNHQRRQEAADGLF